MTRVRYFAAAAECAGTDTEDRPETSLASLRTAIAASHPGLGDILPRCALLVDGVRTDADRPLTGSELIDVLPPFAGG